ncbi:MAG: hypothetical protein EBU52_19150, partial [Cytophagia bacterium]|nr:hypothetical protein [Cytophagia bacterium]
VSSNFSFDRTKFESTNVAFSGDYTTKFLRIEPKVGFFVSKRFLVGGSFSYVWSNTSGSLIGGQDITNKSFGRGIFVRYYQPIVKNFYALVGLDLSWTRQRNEYNLFDPSSGLIVKQEEEVTYSMLQKGIGFAYFINKNISIELMADHFNRFGEENLTLNSTFENRLLLSLGFQIYLSQLRNE